MALNDTFYIDISRIEFAHEFILNKINVCSRLDGRKNYGFVYCIDGEAEYVFSNGKVIKVSGGQIIFLKSNAVYTIQTKGDFRHYTVNFDINEASSNLSFLEDDFCILKSDNSEIYRHIFKKLIMHWRLKNNCYEMYSLANLYEITANFLSELSEKEHNANARARLIPAKEYIDKNFNSQLNLNLLSNLTNMSVTNFRREWTKLYGVSPMEYRDEIRLNYAKEYLLSGYYTVNEVSDKCGFNDTNYFIRFFKKHTGVSPRRFTNQYL